MPSTKERIIQAADKLFYENGYEQTSFADIAAQVQLSRGNFYYHFKTKEEILQGVIAARIVKTKGLLEVWEKEAETPQDRIISFIRILIMNRAPIKEYGCPVGTLCSELAKLDHPALSDANQLFTLFREWLAGQFNLLGLKDQADQFALHLLGRSQGVATLANALKDDLYIEREVEEMTLWLQRAIAAA